MNDIMIERARDRLKRIRQVADRAHDPQMIEMLLKIAAELETDIEKVETARSAANRIGGPLISDP